MDDFREVSEDGSVAAEGLSMASVLATFCVLVTGVISDWSLIFNLGIRVGGALLAIYDLCCETLCAISVSKRMA